MAKYLNSIHDFETAEQMEEAMESSRGVRGVSVKVCNCPNAPSLRVSSGRKSAMSATFATARKESLRHWPWKTIPWTKFDVSEQSELLTMEIRPSTSETIISFVPVRPKRTGGGTPATEVEGNSDCVDESSDESSVDVDVDAANNCRLYTCPEEGCVKTFIHHSSLVKHFDCGKHKRALEYETLYDRAMIEYVTNLECGASKYPTVLEGSRPSLPTVCTILPMAWALKSTQSRRTKFTDNQKQYLNS